MKFVAAISLIVAGLLCATDAIASGGVIEINSQAASVGGITPGDGPGYPVTISRGGSYRLTGDLITSNRAVLLVDISSDRVTLDLNGFTVGTCVTGIVCGSGTAHGIQAFVADAKIHNGVVAGAGGNCIATGSRAVLRDLRVLGCRGSGISTGADSRISHVTVANVVGFGVSMGRGAMLKDSMIAGSDSAAVSVGFNSWIIGNVIRGNDGAISPGGGGIWTTGGYRGNLITENDGVNEVQPIAGAVRNMGQNICGSDTICP